MMGSTASDEPLDLRRFVDAQAPDFDRALAELRAGAKRSHWMWYVFPQLAGLGSSSMSERYAIRSRAEAAAYLTHPVLGPRLRECVTALLAHADRSARDILGSPDDLKLHSSATLFASVAPGDVFDALLERYFGGLPDPRTLELLGEGSEQR
jgi:uncharacterized protein (DUF1810 family)